VAHPKRLTSLRDEWRLIGVRHPSFSLLMIDDAHTSIALGERNCNQSSHAFVCGYGVMVKLGHRPCKRRSPELF
jgi:hypothetical protein